MHQIMTDGNKALVVCPIQLQQLLSPEVAIHEYVLTPRLDCVVHD
jgi:hypothetical protein